MVSTLALILALSGGVAYAASKIRAADIAPGAVRTNKIFKRAIISGKLAVGAVRSNQIADGTVDSTRIHPGAVSSTELADGAVGSAQIRPGSVAPPICGSRSPSSRARPEDRRRSAKNRSPTR